MRNNIKTENLRVEVVPGAGKNQIIEGRPLIIKVKEPPVKNRANKAVAKLLCQYFGKKVKIVSGRKSRNKIIEIG